MNSFSKFNFLSIFSFAIISLITVRPAYADDTVGFGTIIVDDIKYEATAPSRWDTQDWKELGWAGLAVAGTAIFVDRPMRDFMRKQTQGNTFLNDIQNFGQSYAFGVMGGFYVVGLAAGSEKTVQVGEDLITASMISAAINQ